MKKLPKIMIYSREDHVEKIKQLLINAKTNDQYTKIKNDPMTLKDKKQELKQNLKTILIQI